MSRMGTLWSEYKMHKDAQRENIRGHGVGTDLKAWVHWWWGVGLGKIQAFKAPAERAGLA